MCSRYVELIEFTSWWNTLKEEDLHGTRVTAGELNEPMEEICVIQNVPSSFLILLICKTDPSALLYNFKQFSRSKVM